MKALSKWQYNPRYVGPLQPTAINTRWVYEALDALLITQALLVAGQFY